MTADSTSGRLNLHNICQAYGSAEVESLTAPVEGASSPSLTVALVRRVLDHVGQELVQYFQSWYEHVLVVL